jgi:hypothetical protein
MKTAPTDYGKADVRLPLALTKPEEGAVQLAQCGCGGIWRAYDSGES